MPLTPDQQVDFVKAALPRYEKGKSTNLSADLTDYVGVREIFNEDAMKASEKYVIQSGYQFEWRVRTSTSGNARRSEMWAEESLQVRNTLQSATVPWRKLVTGWAWEIDEPEFQSDDETQILNLISIREEDADLDVWKLLEPEVWSSPASSSTNAILGVPHWIVKSAAGEEGFVGGAPSGFTTVAGISPTTYSQWKNYAFDYTNATPDDLLAKLRKACYKTHFKAPDPIAKSQLTLKGGKLDTDKMGHYTTYANQAAFERILESRNDNHGNDVAKYDGALMFKGNVVRAVPYLDANDSSNPWYGINWASLRGIAKKNRQGYRMGPMESAEQPTVRQVYKMWWHNILCINRRVNFVGAQV